MKTPPPTTRCSTGIEGLDDVLRGGLPRDRLYLIQGDPGVGKTTLALQFLLEGVREGERSLYIALSETTEEILGVAESHHWSLESLAIFELSAMQRQLAQNEQSTLFHPADVELNKTTTMLLDEIERVKPRRVVFDSLSELRLLAESPLRFRHQILAFKHFFIGRQCTVLLLDDGTGRGSSDLQVQSVTNAVLTLHRQMMGYGPPRRTLVVDKLRGVKFQEGSHDYVIQSGGLQVFPRLVAAEHQEEFPEEAVSSGIGELDALLGGGLDRGTSTLIMGPAGTGKSSMAFQQVIAAAQRGEKSVIFLFDESTMTIGKRAAGLGMPLNEHIESGSIRLKKIDPAEIAPGEFTHVIKRAVIDEQVGFVVIDSLGGYMQAMPDENFLSLQLHELLSFLRQRGVVTILTLAQHGLVGVMQSPVDVTYIADTVILLRYFEAGGRVKKAISVIKKRSGYHEDTIREFKIGPGGIRVGQPLTKFQGVLSGAPTFHGRPEETLIEGE